MSRGYDQHQSRQQALSLLGKDLARRSGRHCELCDANGVEFATFEVEPVSEEPRLDHCLLICTNCHDQLQKRGSPDPLYWRCLEASAWRELPAIQVTAVRILRKLDNALWAGNLLDNLYLSPEAKAWLAASH